MAHDVFLSYSSKDKFAADAACAVLERSGVRVWMAPRDILPGLGWGASIIDAINAARVMVLVFSGAANVSPQIEREVERAVNKGLPVIPFRIEDVAPSGSLEYFINASHWLDAFTPPMEQHLEKLANVVQRVIEAKYGKSGPSPEETAAQRAEKDRLQREQADGARRAAEEAERRKAVEADARRSAEALREQREQVEQAGREGISTELPPPPPKPKTGLLATLALAVVVVLGGGWYAFTPAHVPDTQQDEFETAMQTDTIPALEAFIGKHPTGPFTKVVTQRRDKLKAIVPAPSDDGGVMLDAATDKSATEQLKRAQERREAETPKQVAVATPATPTVVPSPCGGVTPASLSMRAPAPLSAQEECALRPSAEFRECESCQPMVVIPAGAFTMGSPPKEEGRHLDEGPQHEVRISSPFAVGKFSVTVDEFKAFVSATHYDAGSSCYAWTGTEWKLTKGRSWLDPGFKQTGGHPAACLNWKDAQAYVAWLKKKTGRPYRLLSEAEWEYAARGGTVAPYWQGSSISQNQANYGGNKKGTVPVNSYAANPFGLFNILGNVWQWVEDCYRENYDGAPKDGSAWTTGDCSRRVLRGGSWDDVPGRLRAALRDGNDPGDRNTINGFRLARTLNH